jgi:hypothetical protein
MDAVRRLPDVRRDYAVGERQGGKQQADAFRRALGQAGEDATGDGPASDGGGDGGGARDGDGNRSGNRAGQSGGRTAGGSPPTPSRLQRHAAAGRREDVGVVHVDVYA